MSASTAVVKDVVFHISVGAVIKIHIVCSGGIHFQIHRIVVVAVISTFIIIDAAQGSEIDHVVGNQASFTGIQMNSVVIAFDLISKNFAIRAIKEVNTRIIAKSAYVMDVVSNETVISKSWMVI